MKKHIIKAAKSFAFSCTISMIALFLIEAISAATGHRLSPLTPEFISYFPTETIAFEVDILLYGLFGLAFSSMTFIYEKDSLGFVLQNIIYCLGTSVIWIPVVTFIWQLWKYPPALISTILGFFLTYVIINIVVYNTTRKDISDVNRMLETIE